MKYISADTETTGFLENKNSRVWQVSYIIEDTSKNVPIKELPSLSMYVYLGEEIAWESGALMMNIDNIKKYLKSEINLHPNPLNPTNFGRGDVPKVLTYKDFDYSKRYQTSAISSLTKDFFYIHGIKKALFAGKNVAGFDIPFLEQCNLFPEYMKRYHRVLDPSLGFIQPDDECPPALHEIMNRIPDSFKEEQGLGDLENSHDALDDARCIILAFRYLHSIGKVNF